MSRFVGVMFAGALLSLGVGQTRDDLRRMPLQKPGSDLKSPTTYAMRERRDAKTGSLTSFDPKPRVEVVDALTGRYALKWVGYDGEDKEIRYQRPDMIDAVVRATVTNSPFGYRYRYEVESLQSSHQALAGFAVQTLAANVLPLRTSGVFVGRMPAFPGNGNWWRFAPLSGAVSQIAPGGRAVFEMDSDSAPGLVECVVHGGSIGLSGVGEEMPAELEATLPGYDSWPRGFTVGPVGSSSSLSEAQKLERLATWLPRLQELGWMTSVARGRYEQAIKAERLSSIGSALEADLASGQISPEVAAIFREGSR